MAASGYYQVAAQATMSSYPSIVFTFKGSSVASGIYNIKPLAASATDVSIYFNTSASSSGTAYTGVTGGQVYVNVTGSQIVCTMCNVTFNNSTAGNVTVTGKITKP